MERGVRAAMAGWWVVLLCLVGSGMAGADDILPETGEEPKGLVFSLHEVKTDAPARESSPAVSTPPLAPARVRALLKHLPEPPEAPVRDIAVRDASRPPPLTGATIHAPWPPEGEGHEKPATGPVEKALRVLRHAPEGNVALAPHFSITFSQPMVALSSHQDADAAQVPVSLMPQPPGRWRWLGTQTLVFEPDFRLPAATDYIATVPAGTRSATGARLQDAYIARFSTPAPTLAAFRADMDDTGLNPTLDLDFDQAVDPKAVLARLSVTDPKGVPVPLTLVNADQAQDITDSDDNRSGDAPRYRVQLRAPAPLPEATRFKVELAPGLPSLEGPRVAPKGERKDFRTYGPFEVASHQCHRRSDDGKAPAPGTCDPDHGWSIQLSNDLDPEHFDPASITLSPPVENLKVNAYASTLNLRGQFSGRTSYQVGLPATLTDRYGQTLGKARNVAFTTGDAVPRLIGPERDLIALDPTAPPTISVYTRGIGQLALEVRRVGPEHWDDFANRLEGHPDYRPIAEAPPKLGQWVGRKTLRVEGDPNALLETRIPLSDWLDDGLGQLLVVVSPLGHREIEYHIVTWVQSTRIGLVAVHDRTRLTAWASDLSTGSVLTGMDIGIHGHKTPVPVDDHGMAQLTLPSADTHRLLIARRGKEVAILPRDVAHGYYDTGWAKWKYDAPDDLLRWLVFDDRGMYRPGEEVRVKGWLRRLRNDPRGDLEIDDATTVVWRLHDTVGEELGAGEVALSAQGGFDIGLRLPQTPALGRARLELTAHGGRSARNHRIFHTFQIEEFRRPEYEVTATAPTGPVLVGDSVAFSANAAYYAGGALPGAPTRWWVNARPARYVPPGHDAWRFGSFWPWWVMRNDDEEERFQTFSGQTDASGRHAVEARLSRLRPALPVRLDAGVTVTDVNRQGWSAMTGVLVHPAEHYVGLQTERSVVVAGKPIEVRALVVDIDGQIVPASQVRMRLLRQEWSHRHGMTETGIDHCEQHQREGKPVACRWTPREGGSYRIEAQVHDGKGRPNLSELRVWVPDRAAPASRQLAMDALELVPDREKPHAGDTVQVLVQAPFSGGEGLMTLSRGGILEQRRFALEGSSATLSFEVTDAMVPGVRLDVVVTGHAPATGDNAPADATRPAIARAHIDFTIPPLRRTLAVSATPRDTQLAPGASTRIDLIVRDADGHPVADAELAVVVADEAVLALSDYQLPDPLEAFYAAWPNRVESVFLHTQLQRPEQSDPLASFSRKQGSGMSLDRIAVTGSRINRSDIAVMTPPPPPAPQESPVMRDMAQGKPAASALRTDFSPLALFAPQVRTDAKGHATVPLTLPDSTTRYRVMVVAVDGARAFGTAESALTASLPLTLRPSPPRFLNLGDRFELPIVVQNTGDRPLRVELALRAANATLADSLAQARPGEPGATLAGRVVTVPAHDRVEVRFPAAAQNAGRAQFQVTAVAGALRDAQAFSLPVWTPAVREAFATYGALSEDSLAVQPLRVPGEVWPQSGGLSVSTSSTQLQSLTDALIYLHDYPFQCNEQRASRVLGIAALRDVLDAFDVEDLPPAEALEAQVERELAALAQTQTYEGGWGFWAGEHRSWPYLSVHVAHALARAESKGYTVPPEMRSEALRYLRQIDDAFLAHRGYAPDARRSLHAYALEVRRQLGDANPREAQALLTEAGDVVTLPLEAIGWLLPTLHDSGATQDVARLLRHLENRVTETAGTAHFVTDYGEQGGYLLLHSLRRADGVLLDALLHVQPEHDLIEKLVRGLLAHRVKGRWSNTQENAFILLALDRYFRVREGDVPDFVSRAWLGDAFLGEHAFRGRSTERHETTVPMAQLGEFGDAPRVVLEKDGPGRLYYRIGLSYAPRAFDTPPEDRGFSVERRYEAVDDPGDVVQQADGSWRIRAGARVRVVVTMANLARRYHVALVDPLPAGLEPINAALATSAYDRPDPADFAKNRGWRAQWFDHQNLRDERVEAFASLLWDGVHHYRYLARATTPGDYLAAPPMAEEMYHPETFGRGSSDRVKIE